MKIKKPFIIWLVVFGLAFLAIEANAQKRRNSKIQTELTTEKKVSSDDYRKSIEALMLEGKYQHDGSGELIEIGTIDSVPALLKVLENNPPQIEEIEEDEDVPVVKKIGDIQTLSEIPKIKREPRKSYICTYIHAITALQKITGQKFTDYQDWKNWWEDYLKNKERTK